MVREVAVSVFSQHELFIDDMLTWGIKQVGRCLVNRASIVIISACRFDPFGVVPVWTAKNSGYRFGNYRFIKSKLWALAMSLPPVDDRRLGRR